MKADVTRARNGMPVQAAGERIRNFGEVALGYTPALAAAEAARCLGCREAPCVRGCPLRVDVPAFIARLAAGDGEGAYGIIAKTNPLPAVCGRICQQEDQCEKYCVRGRSGEPVAIGYLERYAADLHIANTPPAPAAPAAGGRRAAVIGSGPAGLSCAGALAAKGYDVTVFEALHEPGGVLVYGIPEFRLPKAVVGREIEDLKALGVKIETNVVAGRTVTVRGLLDEGFGAVFLGTGAGLPKFPGIPGENLAGVYSANEFLTRVNLMRAWEEDAETPVARPKTAAVIGGGNVAIDAARCARRLGAQKVYILYRRGPEEMPARAEEAAYARQEGITFRFLCSPEEILADGEGRARGIRCVENRLGEPDASGRRRPEPLPGSQFTLEADCVVVAIGTSPNLLAASGTPGLIAGPRGGIRVSEDGAASLKGVYAGGDAVTGAATAIRAMGAGKAAADSMDRLLRGEE